MIEDAEMKVLDNSRNYGKRKNADGTITDNTSAKAKSKVGKDEIETAIFDVLHDIRNSKKLRADDYEATVEIQMKLWTTAEGKTMNNLFQEASIPFHLADDALLVLNDLGLPTIIGMFCERGKAFNSENFKRDMASMGIQPLIYLKLHNTLMDWKNASSTIKVNEANSFSEISMLDGTEDDESDEISDQIELAQRLTADPLPLNHGGRIHWQGNIR